MTAFPIVSKLSDTKTVTALMAEQVKAGNLNFSLAVHRLVGLGCPRISAKALLQKELGDHGL